MCELRTQRRIAGLGEELVDIPGVRVQLLVSRPGNRTTIHQVGPDLVTRYGHNFPAEVQIGKKIGTVDIKRSIAWNTLLADHIRVLHTYTRLEQKMGPGPWKPVRTVN